MKKIILETANGSVILEGADASEYLDTKLGNMLPPDLMKGFEASLAVAANKKKAINTRTQPANLPISFAMTLDAKSFMKAANESVEALDESLFKKKPQREQLSMEEYNKLIGIVKACLSKSIVKDSVQYQTLDPNQLRYTYMATIGRIMYLGSDAAKEQAAAKKCYTEIEKKFASSGIEAEFKVNSTGTIDTLMIESKKMTPVNESADSLTEAAGKKEKDVKDMTELEFLEYWTGIKPGKSDKKFTTGNELLYAIVMDVKAWVTEMLKGKFLTMAFPGKDLNTMQFISYLRSIFIDICYFQAGQMTSYDYYYVTMFGLNRKCQKRIQKLCKQYKFFESLMKLMANCICIAINNKYSKYFKDQSVMYEQGSYLIFMDVPEGYSIL